MFMIQPKTAVNGTIFRDLFAEFRASDEVYLCALGGDSHEGIVGRLFYELVGTLGVPHQHIGESTA